MKKVGKLIVGIILAVGCSESTTPDPALLGYEYYPINVGQYRIYDVEEISFQVVSFDTVVYQLRETVFDSIVSQDQITYLLRRDIRASAVDPWESDSVWSVTRQPTFLSIVENGIPFIKLTFPISAGNQWDGNSLNSLSERTYYYESLASPLIDSVAAAAHVRVVIEDIEANITGVDLRSEIYVSGIGLVEKDYLTQVNCTASSCGEDLGKVIAGRSLKQVLIDVGHE